jgi:hypothetical protein
MSCELWIRGSAWSGFEVVAVDQLEDSNYSVSTLPPITYKRPGGNSSSEYYLGRPTPTEVAGWYGTPQYYLKNCHQPDAPHDCVNGNCLPKSTYNTPGVFANLAACQSGCAQNSNCTGECVDPAEIAGLRQALNNLQSKFCR